jgi:membrane protein
MNAVQKAQHAVDRFQQRRPWLGYVIGAWKKFGDDQAGNLAALVSYYAFASIFPLLLVLYTVLDLVLRGNPKLKNDLLNSAFSQYPLIGGQLRSHAHSLSGTGVALFIGIALTLFGALGVASAIQNALNTVWAVPYTRRPGFPLSILRSVGLILVIGPGLIITITLSSYAGGTGHVISGAGARIGALLVSLALNVGVFWLAFRVGTAKEVRMRDMLLGAVIAAIGWQVLQYFGGYLIGHQLKTNSAYGTFGVVLGLLAWFYLQAQLTLYAAEFNVVRARRIWPRSMFPPPLTDADVRAYQMYAAAQQRRTELAVVLQRSGEPDRPDQPAVPVTTAAIGSGAAVSTAPAAVGVTSSAGTSAGTAPGSAAAPAGTAPDSAAAAGAAVRPAAPRGTAMKTGSTLLLGLAGGIALGKVLWPRG